MYMKFVMLLLAVLLLFTSAEAKSDFDFSIGGEKISFDSECIEFIQYVDKDEVNAENLIFRFTNECGKRLSAMTRSNIGKQISIAYNGNKLTSAMIASRLSTSFRISTKDVPRVLLMQLLNEHEYLLN